MYNASGGESNALNKAANMQNGGFADKTLEFIRKNDLLSCGDKVLVCLSGGADSTCLLRVMCTAAQRLNLTVCAAHVNHMLRGDDADRDERFCAKLCERYGVELYTLRTDVAKEAARTHESFEAAARRIRYDFFFSLKKKHHFDKIATAHNRNDNAETSILYYLRGSGIDGIKGIAPKRGDGVIRPILWAPRGEIERYLAEINQDYVTDATNFTAEYTRNKIRLKLLPYLAKEYNPNIDGVVADNALLLNLDAQYMEDEAAALYGKIARYEGGMVKIDAEVYKKSAKALALRVIRKAICTLKGSMTDISYDTVMRCDALFGQGCHGRKVSVSKDCFAKREYGSVIFYKEKTQLSFSYKLNIGETYIPEIGMTIRLSFAEKADFSAKNCEYFDYNCLKGQIYIRNRKTKDRFTPFNMKGSKRLKDFFIDEKIAASERERIPLLVCGDEILWVCGVRRSALYTVDGSTKKILRTEFLEGTKNADA